MNSVIKEEIIYIKSQIVYLLAFPVLIFFSFNSVEFTTRQYFYYLNYLTVFISSILITLYLIQIVVGWVFEERNFYQRSLIYSFFTTFLLAITFYFGKEDVSIFTITVISVLYIVFIELPRLAIVFELDSDKLDFKFLRYISKHLNKGIIPYLILIFMIIVQYFSDANFNMYIILTGSSVIVISVLTFYAWRLNSNKTLNKLKKTAIILGGVLLNVIIIKYSTTLI